MDSSLVLKLDTLIQAVNALNASSASFNGSLWVVVGFSTAFVVGLFIIKQTFRGV